MGAPQATRGASGRSDLGTGGSLAFILSTSVKTPLSNLALSNVLRPGLALHVKDLADHYGGGPKPVRAVGLLPFKVETERSRWGGLDPTGIPLGRIGEADEFGRSAAFLLSAAASYITGSVLPVDGGALRAL